MSGVSLSGDKVSLLVGVSLLTSSVEMPWSGESLKGIKVSLVSANVAPPMLDVVFKFNNKTSSMYLPLFGGFA